MVPINYIAIIASAILAMIVGYLWYGPLFGKQWASHMGWTSEEIQEKMRRGSWAQYLIQAINALIMSFVLAHSIVFASAYLHQSGLIAGLQGGLWAWLGFVVPVSLGSILWDNKPWILWAINAGYYLTVLLLMGAVLGYWA